jgi:hypothetical protein
VILPEEPRLVVPVLNERAPLTPFVPALEVRITMSPLLVAAPFPVDNDTAPPVSAVESPPLQAIVPPVPAAPVPLLTITSPLLPEAVPLANFIIPDDPELVVPDEKLNDPLTPFTPAFMDLKKMLPLDDAVPAPLVSESNPPVVAVAVPPTAMMSPPVPAALTPATKEIDPVLPFVPAAEPVEIRTAPLLPSLVVPVLNCSEPLTPAVPALADLTTTNPEDFAVPAPEVTEKKPPVPVALDVEPACIDTNPEVV